MTWTEVVNLKGDKGLKGDTGETGPRGLPAPDAVPADEAVSEYITGPSATKSSLIAGFVDRATGKTFAGPGALAELPTDYNIGSAGTVVAIGYKAMNKMQQVKKAIAIGTNAMSLGTVSRDNIAIGEYALRNVQSESVEYSQVDKGGSRNTAIGTNALLFTTSGLNHIGIGRNAGQCVVSGEGLTAVGSNAGCGHAPIGLTGDIENWSPYGANTDQLIRATLIGSRTGFYNVAANTVAVGADALRYNKKSDSNTAVGAMALRDIDSDTGYAGGLRVDVNITGTYAQSGNVLELTFTGHGCAVGDTIFFRLLDGTSQTFGLDVAPAVVVTVPASNRVTVAHPVSRTAAGAAVMSMRESVTQATRNENNTALGTGTGAVLRTGSNNTAIGRNALAAMTAGSTNTAVGYLAAGRMVSGTNVVAVGFESQADVIASAGNTSVGHQAIKGVSTGSTTFESTGVGYQVMSDITTGGKNTAVGYRAGNLLTTGDLNTAIGHSAGRYMVDGSSLATVTNTTAVGQNSRVSGSNQVQIGDSATSTYVYGTVQNRSDLRDKADIRDTVLGLDFIEKLRPVDYRWDMREDYDGGERDGSQKRARFHHGFVAQEVQSIIAETGVDFGGLQDHSLAGGSDVFSIGYDEIIAPLVKAVQEQQAIIAELIARVESLEGGADEWHSRITS